MNVLPWIAVGGAIGAVTRFLVTAAATATLGPRLPWGTLAVNVIGSLLLGVLLGAADRLELSPEMRALLTTGGMGALTTFSTFSVETVRLVERGDTGWALANIAANLVVSLGAAWLGLGWVRRP